MTFWHLGVVPILAVVDIPTLTGRIVNAFGNDISFDFERVLGDVEGITSMDICPLLLPMGIVSKFLVVFHR